jgi:hypothetical protein
MNTHGLAENLAQVQTLDDHRWVVITDHGDVFARGIPIDLSGSTTLSLQNSSGCGCTDTKQQLNPSSASCKSCNSALWFVIPILLLALAVIIGHCVYAYKNPDTD